MTQYDVRDDRRNMIVVDDDFDRALGRMVREAIAHQSPDGHYILATHADGRSAQIAEMTGGRVYVREDMLK